MPFVSFDAPQQAASSLAAIFPLPLSIFETFMLADARPGYPMMCDLELHFEGCIDRAAFDSGLAFAMDRNPLFRAVVSDASGRQLQWQLTDELPRVDWAPLGTPRGPAYDQYFDLRGEIGLRIWVRQGADRSTVLLHFHHACSDGLGSFGFIEDFLIGYAASFSNGAAIAARPLDPRRLLHRQDFGIDTRSLYRRTADWLIGVREGVRFFAQSPWSLPSCRDPMSGAEPADDAGFVSQALSADITSALRRAANGSGLTVNDIVLRDLFHTLRDWGRAVGDDPGRRQLRILMPQNLRQREDRAMPAANVMSFNFLTRRADACDQPDALLQSIGRETELIRRHRLSLYFLGSMGFAQSTGWFEWLMRRSFCFTTAVLTNLGDPTRRFVARLPRSGTRLMVGNLLLDQFTGGPPVRPLTGTAISIFNNAHHILISLKCDPHGYTSLDSRRFLGQYITRLQSTAEQALAANTDARQTATG